MNVRKVVTRSSRKFKGYFPSRKLDRMVQYESPLERDAILLFEFSSGVKHYQEQPELINYERDCEMRRYFPDFSLTLGTGEVIHVEVKPISEFHSVEIVNKFNAVIQHYARNGRNFKILVDSDIRKEPRLTNLKRLARVLQQNRDLDLTDIEIQTIKLMRSNSTFTVLSLAQIIGKRNVLLLLARGMICCDITIDLYAESNFLHLPEEQDHETILA